MEYLYYSQDPNSTPLRLQSYIYIYITAHGISHILQHVLKEGLV